MTGHWGLRMGAILILLASIIVATCSACGLSREELDGVVTFEEMDRSATQTAGAPMATPIPSSTPTPTPTIPPTPTLTPSPTPPSAEALAEFTADKPAIHLAADGSGDYPDLATAVEAAAAGTTIFLEAGTYRLNGDGYFDIDRSLRLIGAGMEETEIVSSSHEWVISFVGPGTFAAEGISFQNQGEYQGPAAALIVLGGTVVLTGCEFSGPVGSEDNDQVSASLKLLGDVDGLVQGSKASDNGAGILLGGGAQVLLENNTFSDNAHWGIVYQGESGGVARGNDCSRNGRDGIVVTEQARPVLEHNTCTENEGSGIVYIGDFGGEARRNTCSNNGEDGIVVSDQAQPILEDNICSENESAGIAYSFFSAGMARRNDCSRNGTDGIYVEHLAQPVLEGNNCTDNAGAGIVYWGESGGAARRNVCSRNYVGIFLGHQAQPTLEENICFDNEMDGLTFFDRSGGVARANECYGNRVGIRLRDSANPTLSDNNCHDNVEENLLDERS